MSFFKNNRIVKRVILGFFVLIFILTPLSISVTPHIDSSELVVSIQPNTVHAFLPLLAGLGALGTLTAFDFNPAKAIVLVLGNLVLNAMSYLTAMGGWLLEGALENLVFGMGDWINNKSLGNSINSMWGLIRDICNLLFIFGFIYTGIRTIIDPENAETKRFISRIIIAALLINFSLFIVKVVVDFTNFLSFQIFNQLTSGGGSISAALGNALGIISIFSIPNSETLAQITGGGSMWFYFIASIFLLIAAFVFIASAVLFVVRFVVLIFIMIFSPLLFAATVFPQTEHFASDLWKKLFSYSFYAPVYILLILISIQILQAMNFSGTEYGFVKEMVTGKQPTDSFSVILKFTIAIAFMVSSLVAAKKLGIAGGEMAISVGNNLRGKAQGAIGRATVGKASYALLHAYEKHDAKMSTEKEKNTWRGRLSRGTRKTLSVVGVDDRAIRETLHAGEHAKFGGHYSYEDDHKYHDEHKKRQTAIIAAKKREEAIEHASNPKPGVVVTPADMETMVKSIKALTTDQMKDIDLNILTREDVAVHLSTKQIEELEKTGKYSDQQITDIKDARKKGVINIATVGTARKDPATGLPIGTPMVGGQSQREILAQRGSDELAKMPIEVFTHTDMAPLLTPDMVEAKMKSGISIGDRDLIRDTIDAQIVTENRRWVALPGHVAGSTPPYVKQWQTWSARNTFGARLGLTNI